MRVRMASLACATRSHCLDIARGASLTSAVRTPCPRSVSRKRSARSRSRNRPSDTVYDSGSSALTTEMSITLRRRSSATLRSAFSRVGWAGRWTHQRTCSLRSNCSTGNGEPAAMAARSSRARCTVCAVKPPISMQLPATGDAAASVTLPCREGTSLRGAGADASAGGSTSMRSRRTCWSTRCGSRGLSSMPPSGWAPNTPASAAAINRLPSSRISSRIVRPLRDIGRESVGMDG